MTCDETQRFITTVKPDSCTVAERAAVMKHLTECPACVKKHSDRVRGQTPTPRRKMELLKLVVTDCQDPEYRKASGLERDQ